MSVGQRILERSKQKGMNQSELALTAGVSKNAISNYVTDRRIPDTMTCLNISKVLEVSMEWILTGKNNDTTNVNINDLEKHILENFRALPDEQKTKLVNTTSVILAQLDNNSVFDIEETPIKKPKNTKKTTTKQPITQVIDDDNTIVEYPLHLIRAAAGLGNPVDNNEYDMIPIDTTKHHIPNGADRLIKIQGDSMTPDYNDGDILWVKDKVHLENKQEGIFIINKEAVFKVLDKREDGTTYLYSYNEEEYPPRLIKVRTEDQDLNDDIRTIGQVVGVYKTEQ